VEDGAFIPFVCHSRERNNISFEDRERTLEEIMLLFFNTLHLWTLGVFFCILPVNLRLLITFQLLIKKIFLGP